MLLDLGRNDVGKVVTNNSVKVTEKFKVEKYSHVMHIVSNVVGSNLIKNLLYLKLYYLVFQPVRLVELPK